MPVSPSGLKFILREDQEPSRIERLFLGYGDKWPRKWPRIANPVPIRKSGANPSPLVSLVPFLTSPELPILISSHGQSLANPGQSGANPRPIRDQLRS